MKTLIFFVMVTFVSLVQADEIRLYFSEDEVVSTKDDKEPSPDVLELDDVITEQDASPSTIKLRVI